MRLTRAGTFSGCGVGVLRLLLARTPRTSAMEILAGLCKSSSIARLDGCQRQMMLLRALL
jgi:hypothetical protein